MVQMVIRTAKIVRMDIRMTMIVAQRVKMITIRMFIKMVFRMVKMVDRMNKMVI